MFAYYGYTSLSLVSAAIIPFLLNIFMGDADPSVWNLPANTAVPFNTQSIFGWLLTYFYQSNMSLIYFVYLIITTTHFACCCYYIIAICDHFEQLITSIQADSMHKADEKFQRAIQLHVKIYE